VSIRLFYTKTAGQHISNRQTPFLCWCTKIDKLPAVVQQFVSSQINAMSVSCSDVRLTHQNKLLALGLYYKSSSAYRFMQHEFHLQLNKWEHYEYAINRNIRYTKCVYTFNYFVVINRPKIINSHVSKILLQAKSDSTFRNANLHRVRHKKASFIYSHAWEINHQLRYYL